MISKVRIAPPNSLFFISDKSGGEAPNITREGRLWSKPSCVAVGCLAFMDGETEVSIGGAREVKPAGALVFGGNVETPSRLIVVSTSDRKQLLKFATPTGNTRVRIGRTIRLSRTRFQLGWNSRRDDLARAAQLLLTRKFCPN
jgi:hypothetical protein